MKTLGDAALLRNRMVALLEEAAQETDEARRRRLMTFVVAGGGFAGVETVGAINDFLRETVRYYPELDPSMLRVVLVHPGKVVLPELGERLGRYAQEKLRHRGVEVRLETRVTGYEDGAVKRRAGRADRRDDAGLDGGRQAGRGAGPLPVEKVNGRVKVNEFLEVPGHEGVVWAVGDCAAVPDGNGGLHPPTAQHGMREAVAAARNIEAAIKGGAPQAVPVLDDRAVGVDRPPHRRRAGPGDAILGLRRLVAVAERLPEQAAGDLEEGAGGDQVVARPAVPARDRAVGDAPGRRTDRTDRRQRCAHGAAAEPSGSAASPGVPVMELTPSPEPGLIGAER